MEEHKYRKRWLWFSYKFINMWILISMLLTKRVGLASVDYMTKNTWMITDTYYLFWKSLLNNAKAVHIHYSASLSSLPHSVCWCRSKQLAGRKCISEPAGSIGSKFGFLIYSFCKNVLSRNFGHVPHLHGTFLANQKHSPKWKLWKHLSLKLIFFFI